MRRKRWTSRRATYSAAAMAVAAAALAFTGSASAATYNATDTTSFATAVTNANANPGSTINVAASLANYGPAATVDLKANVTIQGPAQIPNVNQQSAQFDGTNVQPPGTPLFKIETGVTATFSNIAITNGGGSGAPAVDNFGTLNVSGSSISGNIGADLVVEPGGTTNITNSTLSDGGDFGLIDQGTATLNNVTIARNAVGGIDDSSGTLKLINSIVAKNTGKQCSAAVPAANADHSLDSDGSCGVGALSSKDPLLGPINVNGGSTPSDVPAAASPAVDAGNPGTCSAVDQRGAVRPDDAGTACDIGAVERYAVTPVFTTTNIKVASATASKAVTYTPTWTDAGAPVKSTCAPASGSTFNASASPGTATTVNCTGTDSFGNAGSGSFTVTVIQDTPPTINTPANQTATSPDGNPTVVNYGPVTATDSADGTIPATCAPASGSTFPLGATTVTCNATNSAGQKATPTTFTVTVTFSGDLASNTGNVKGTVPFQLSITAFVADFGPFTPGIFQGAGSTGNDPNGNNYSTTAAVTVTSSDTSTTLSINDTSSNAATAGHLVNGAYSLIKPVMDQASSTSPVAVTDSATPVALTGTAKQLLHYTGSVANDAVTLGFQQFIGKTEGLHRGVYAANVLLQLVGTP